MEALRQNFTVFHVKQIQCSTFWYTATALSITFCAFLRGDGPHCCPRRRRPPHWSGAKPAARNRIRRWSTLLVRNFPNEKFSFSRSSFALNPNVFHLAAVGMQPQPALPGMEISSAIISFHALHFISRIARPFASVISRVMQLHFNVYIIIYNI